MKEIIILSIVVVLVILIITLYEHLTISNAGNAPCTGTQVCCDPPTTPPTAPISMFSFKFCLVPGLTWEVFADSNNIVGSETSATPGLTPLSLLNYSNCPPTPDPSHSWMWFLTTDTNSGSGIIYQHTPYNTSQEFCYAMLIFYNTNTIYNQWNSGYLGIVVNYSFANSMPFTYENVANGANVKNLQMSIVGTNGETPSTGSYLGVCDLTSWYNSLSSADQIRIGTYNNKTIPSIQGDGMLNPMTQLPSVLGTNYNPFDIGSRGPTCFRNGSHFGAIVTSYYYGATAPGMPYYPFYF